MEANSAMRSGVIRNHKVMPVAISLACLAIGFLTSCRNVPKPSPQPTEDGGEAEPSREYLIEVVRKQLGGKTYQRPTPGGQVATTRRVPHSCTEYDVEADPNARNNPELAKCPRVGAIYYVLETIYVPAPPGPPQIIPCPILPGPQAGWFVKKTGDDTWQVSFAGSSWNVKKEKFETKGGTTIQVTQSRFAVTANQPC